MSLKQLAARAGFKFLEDSLKPGSVNDITLRTAIAINTWALEQSEIGEQPFPAAGRHSLVLSDAFEIPAASWGRVWFQRQFWLVHKQSGIESRWINGRTAPQETLE